MKILILDDHPDLVDILTSLLKKEGYEIYSAFNGQDALILAREIKFDLVISDLQMPEMNGIEFGYKFRMIHPETFIIFFSAQLDGHIKYKKDFVVIKNNELIYKDYSQLLIAIKTFFQTFPENP